MRAEHGLCTRSREEGETDVQELERLASTTSPHHDGEVSLSPSGREMVMFGALRMDAAIPNCSAVSARVTSRAVAGRSRSGIAGRRRGRIATSALSSTLDILPISARLLTHLTYCKQDSNREHANSESNPESAWMVPGRAGAPDRSESAGRVLMASMRRDGTGPC